MPQAARSFTASFGQSVSCAARAGHIGRVFDIARIIMWYTQTPVCVHWPHTAAGKRSAARRSAAVAPTHSATHATTARLETALVTARGGRKVRDQPVRCL